MILPDLNLLVHAYNRDSPVHAGAKRWWEELLSGNSNVALAWVVALGFLRLVTNRTVVVEPLPVEKACDIVGSWLARPQVAVLHPGERHAAILFELLRTLGTAGNLTTDAHLAALAIEHDCELHSTDSDFSRFSGLRWRNPLTTRPSA